MSENPVQTCPNQTVPTVRSAGRNCGSRHQFDCPLRQWQCLWFPRQYATGSKRKDHGDDKIL